MADKSVNQITNEATTVADADVFYGEDQSDSWAGFKITWANLKAALFSAPTVIPFDATTNTATVYWSGLALVVIHNKGITSGLDFLVKQTNVDPNVKVEVPGIYEYADGNTVLLDFGVTLVGTYELTITTAGQGDTGATGEGVPTGGTTGQVLAKTSATDYATEWTDQGGGLPTYFTRAALEASTAEGDGDLVFCYELITIYVRQDTAGDKTRDGLFICNTGSGGFTRFVGVAGKYTYDSANFKSVTMAISFPPTNKEASEVLTSTIFGYEIRDIDATVSNTYTLPLITSGNNGSIVGLSKQGAANPILAANVADHIFNLSSTQLTLGLFGSSVFVKAVYDAGGNSYWMIVTAFGEVTPS